MLYCNLTSQYKSDIYSLTESSNPPTEDSLYTWSEIYDENVLNISTWGYNLKDIIPDTVFEGQYIIASLSETQRFLIEIQANSWENDVYRRNYYVSCEVYSEEYGWRGWGRLLDRCLVTHMNTWGDFYIVTNEMTSIEDITSLHFLYSNGENFAYSTKDVSYLQFKLFLRGVPIVDPKLFEIVLYRNTSENSRVNKNIEKIKSIVGAFNNTNETDILNPTFMVNEETFNANYLFVPKLNRYYYITDIKALAKHYIITTHIDVLMTYRGELANTHGLVARQEFRYNSYIPDNVPKMAQKQTKIIEFPQGFSNPHYVLTVVGGAN